jgi:hypothetical protein
MSIFQIHQVEPPRRGVIHWLGVGTDDEHGYCGMFGYTQFHTNQREQVTCAKCNTRLLKADHD